MFEKHNCIKVELNMNNTSDYYLYVCSCVVYYVVFVSHRSSIPFLDIFPRHLLIVSCDSTTFLQVSGFAKMHSM